MNKLEAMRALHGTHTLSFRKFMWLLLIAKALRAPLFCQQGVQGAGEKAFMFLMINNALGSLAGGQQL